jgi:hypothetical protein
MKLLFTFAILIITLLNSNSLTSRYKEMMDIVSKQTETVLENKTKDTANINTQQNYDLAGDIKKIQSLKQDTFESSNEFNARISTAITKLQNKVRFFARNGSKEYSAGTATMKSYDADKERMKLILTWNSDLKSIFPEIKKLKTVSLNISRDKAKTLFSDHPTHYFHITISYIDNSFIISKILIYDKYELYKPDSSKSITKRTYSQFDSTQDTSTSISSVSTPKYKKTTSCQNYIATRQLNVRSYPGKGNNIIGRLYRNEEICIYDFSGKWGRFDRGYVSGKYLRLKSQKKYQTIGVVYGLDLYGDGFLSIRTKPKGREIGRLYNGNKIEILGKRGKWYKIKTLNNGLIGWSHGNWISVH